MKIQRHQDILRDGFVFDTVHFNSGKITQIGFLHGFGASPEVMYPLLEWLAVMLDVTIIAIRMPCHGVSGNVKTFDDFINRIGQWCEEVGLYGDLVIGHSLGALVLPIVAEQFPDQIGAGYCMSMPTKQASGKPDLFRRLLRVGSNATATTFLASLEAWRAGRGPMYGWAVRKTASDGIRFKNLIEILLDAPDTDPILRRVQIPIKYVWGENDTATPAPYPLSEFPGETDILVGEGHCFPLKMSSREHILADVRKLLASLPPPEPASAS